MWIEFIQLRKAKANPELTMAVRQLVEAMQDIEGLKERHILQHARYQSDTGVVLIWDSVCQSEGSSQGMFLADFLGGYGTVDHAVWKHESKTLGSGNSADGR